MEAKPKLTTAGIRERRLQKFPHWEEMELRLRCRWTPDRVLAWYTQRWPGEPAPNRMTLYRFLSDQPEAWFVRSLEELHSDTARVPRLLVLQEQVALIETQTMRIRKMLQFEQGFEGLPLPEVRANIETLGKLLQDHLRAQQELGLEPRVVATRAAGDDGRPGEGQEQNQLVRLVERVVELPSEEFIPALMQLLGPPRVNGRRLRGVAQDATSEGRQEGR